MTLRLRIVILVLLATLVPAALLVVYLVGSRSAAIGDAKHSLSALAGHAAENLGDKVGGTVQLLHGLSRAPDLDAADRGACSAFLGDVLERYPQYTGLLTVRPDGQLHCDSLRSGRTLDLNDRAYFKRARVSTEPAFETVFGRLTGIAVMQVAYPARDGMGQLKYVLLASLNLAQFAASFVTASPYPEISVLIWDDKGTLMVRLPDEGPLKLSGTSQAQSALYGFIRTARVGDAAELPGPDGKTKMWVAGVLPVEGGELRISLGMPLQALLAKPNRDLRHALILIAIAWFLAFFGALAFADLGIRRPVARISAAAARQGRGDLAARIGTPYPRGELGELMIALDAAAGSVEGHQAEVARKSEELRRTNRMLRMLSAINSTIVRVHNRDELLAEACRIASDEGQFSVAWAGLLDRHVMQFVPVAWRGVDEVYLEPVPRLTADTDNIIGLVLRERRPIVVNDIEGDSRLFSGKETLARGTRSLAAFPLIASGEIVGFSSCMLVSRDFSTSRR